MNRLLDKSFKKSETCQKMYLIINQYDIPTLDISGVLLNTFPLPWNSYLHFPVIVVWICGCKGIIFLDRHCCCLARNVKTEMINVLVGESGWGLNNVFWKWKNFSYIYWKKETAWVDASLIIDLNLSLLRNSSFFYN